MSHPEETDSSPSAPRCSQCGKSAVCEVGTSPLCVDHYEALRRAELMAQQALNIKWNQAAALLNEINAQLDRSMPFGPPHARMPLIPTPSFSGGNPTYISVTGGTVGAINTGTIEHLNVTIRDLAQMGQTALADAVRELSQVVVDDPNLSKDEKDEVLEQVEVLASQASVPPQERSLGVLKGLVRAIPAALTASKDALDVWDKVSPGLRATLGL